VTLGALSVAVWPVPAVAVDGVRVQDPKAADRNTIAISRVEVRPDWRGALRGQPGIATLVVRGADLPVQGVDAVLAGLQKAARGDAAPAGGGATSGPAPGEAARWLPRRTVLQAVTWINDRGVRTTVDADAQISPDGLPEEMSLDITAGRLAGTRLTLVRGQAGAGDTAMWNLKARLGGGTVQGPLRLKLPRPSATGGKVPAMQLAGELQTRGVEVSALTAPSRPLSGRLDADTTLSASGHGFAELPDALQSQTRFTVRDAELQGLDLLQAVRTVGLSRGGSTRLDTLTGQLQTRGRAAHLQQLVASSGVLTARGDVTVSPARALGGRVTVELARGVTGGLVAVPVEVSGTLESPAVSVSRGALLGAAIGTAVMPGVGTGAGAKLGDKIDKGLKGLFGR
jgi:hypothetical protein